MAYFDNPAGRLLANFQQVRSIPGNTSAVTAWARVFNVEESDRAAFMARVAKLYQFAEDTRELIAALPDAAPEIYLKNFDEVEAALSLFMVIRDINVEQFLSKISPRSGEYCLEICSHLLHVRRVERSIGDHDRTSLVDQLDDLIQTIKDSEDLDDEARKWILTRLVEIRATLTEQRLYSTEDAEQAVDKLMGGLRRKVRYLASLTKSGAATKFIAFAVAVDLAINIAANTHELTSKEEPPKPSPIVIEIQSKISPPDSAPALPAGSVDGEVGAK